MSQTLSSTKTW